jgi:hypothetical protein
MEVIMLAPSTKFAVDANRPAQQLADETGLPQTVFYHPDYAHSCAVNGAAILRDRRHTKQIVTWLPSNYFVS